MIKTNRNFLFYSSLQKVMQNSKVLILFLLFPPFLTACSFNEIFYKFHSFPYSEWKKQTAVQFEVPIKDISVSYDVFLELRHTNTYSFRNLWLLVNYKVPNKNSQQDTICIELADMYGNWYGNGIHLYSYTFPYQLNIRYPDQGVYVYTIHQGMLKNPLKGISDFGLRIVKKTF